MANTYNVGRVRMNLRDEWDQNTDYTTLDLVYHRGCSYVAKKDNIGVEPDEDNETSREYWMLMSKPDNNLYYRIVPPEYDEEPSNGENE